MFKCIILLVVLALCHQAISMYYPEASGTPEESSVAASDEHVTWNTRRGFREPETVMESVIHRDIVGRYRNKKDRQKIVAIMAKFRNDYEKHMHFMGMLEDATKLESKYREGRSTFKIAHVLALSKHPIPKCVNLAENFRDKIKASYPNEATDLNEKIQSALQALWKLFLRVIINNYKFYDLTPGYQLLAVERRTLLMLVDTIKAKMVAGRTEDLGLNERLLDDDGMGFRGRQESEDDDLYFKLEKFHEVLDEEHRKLDLLEAARAGGDYMKAEDTLASLKTNDEINKVFKGLDFPEEFYCLHKIKSMSHLFVADYLIDVLIIRCKLAERFVGLLSLQVYIDADFLGIEAETMRDEWNKWAPHWCPSVYSEFLTNMKSKIPWCIEYCPPHVVLAPGLRSLFSSFRVRPEKEKKHLVHMPELDKYSIRSSLDTNSMNEPQYHQTAEHAESSSSAQASFYGDDAHILPFLQRGLGQMDINSHSTESFGSNIRDVPSNQRDMGVTYTRASDDSWPHHTLS
ncbi:hypothetical protein SeLEV6574_g05329 [Synchytrium endobioticum]|nr:hypothetical protein SeLEV6574_g05329 [Synchytrium endobioticum]